MKGLSFNIFYYKNYLLCKIFPNYVADIIKDLYLIPRSLPQQPYEAEFEKKTKHNILKIPTAGYKERAEKFEENNKERKDIKLTRVPELPEEITVLEFLPEENIEKRQCTVICSHGFEGRGTNFFKFIPKLTEKGFRVLAPDYPLHGNTGGTEAGLHGLGWSLNCILNYIKEPVILLSHSLGINATTFNYYISDEKTRNQIKGFVGIGTSDITNEYFIDLGRSLGGDDYTNNLFIEKVSERFGINSRYLDVSDIIRYFNYPCLIVHDENDRELSVNCAINVSKHIQERFQTYKIGDKEYPCFHKTKGLGHRRILRDDNVVKVVVDFISNIKI